MLAYVGAWDQDLAVGLRVLVTVVLLHILLGDKDDRHVTTRTVHLLSQACANKTSKTTVYHDCEHHAI